MVLLYFRQEVRLLENLLPENLLAEEKETEISRPRIPQRVEPQVYVPRNSCLNALSCLRRRLVFVLGLTICQIIAEASPPCIVARRLMFADAEIQRRLTGGVDVTGLLGRVGMLVLEK